MFISRVVGRQVRTSPSPSRARCRKPCAFWVKNLLMTYVCASTFGYIDGVVWRSDTCRVVGRGEAIGWEHEGPDTVLPPSQSSIQSGHCSSLGGTVGNVISTPSQGRCDPSKRDVVSSVSSSEVVAGSVGTWVSDAHSCNRHKHRGRVNRARVGGTGRGVRRRKRRCERREFGPEPAPCCHRRVVASCPRSARVGGAVRAPYSDAGHARPALRGLTTGHAHGGMPSGELSVADVVRRGLRPPRGTRGSGVVPVLLLIVLRKTASLLFLWWEKRVRP